MNIYNTIYQIIAISCLSLTFVKFEPIQFFIRKIKDFPGKIYNSIYTLLSCSKCTGFWFGLILTQSLYQACIISVLTSYLSWITNRL